MRVYWQVSSENVAAANHAAKYLAIFQFPVHILSEDMLETVEQDVNDF